MVNVSKSFWRVSAHMKQSSWYPEHLGSLLKKKSSDKALFIDFDSPIHFHWFCKNHPFSSHKNCRFMSIKGVRGLSLATSIFLYFFVNMFFPQHQILGSKLGMIWQLYSTVSGCPMGHGGYLPGGGTDLKRGYGYKLDAKFPNFRSEDPYFFKETLLLKLDPT